MKKQKHLILLCSVPALWIVLLLAIDRLAQRNNGYISLLHSNAPEIELQLAAFASCLTVFLYLLRSDNHESPIVPIGSLRQHLPAISKLIESANCNSVLRVMLDCSDYGSLENYEDHLKIIRELRTALTQRHVTVRFLLMGEGAPVSRANPSVSTTENYRSFQRTESYKQYIQQFRGQKEPQSWEEFFDLSKSYMKRVLEALERWGANLKTISEDDARHIPMFLFATGQEVIYIRLDEQPPQGRRTTDTDRIRELTNDFDRYWNLKPDKQEQLVS